MILTANFLVDSKPIAESYIDIGSYGLVVAHMYQGLWPVIQWFLPHLLSLYMCSIIELEYQKLEHHVDKTTQCLEWSGKLHKLAMNPACMHEGKL
jgi:hypothetical protein